MFHLSYWKGETSLSFALLYVKCVGIYLAFSEHFMKQTNKYNKTETNSQIQRTNEWLWAGEGGLGEIGEGD